ncbi:MAG TPA: 4Fe-4S binding protein [Anaerolineae bacterium]|nr:4Fe-4S binding protein [Anaerolineae bacterium]
MPSHSPPPKIPRVDEGRCQACRKCAARKVCRVKAIVAIDPGESPFIDDSLCYSCLVCVPACPHEAIVA